MASLVLKMPFREDHELHVRRRRRNTWIACALGGFAVLIFGITVAKLADGNLMEAFDHTVRPSLLEKAN